MVSRRKDVACRVVAQHIFLGGGGSVWAAFLMNTVITDLVLRLVPAPRLGTAVQYGRTG